jgi:hypothetical protein
MADDRKRVTVRLPQEAYEQLCAELSAFSTDTARFQYVVQFYLDHKERKYIPGPPGDCTSAPDDGERTDTSENKTYDAPTAEGRPVGGQTLRCDGRLPDYSPSTPEQPSSYERDNMNRR